jgi:hypothetical protein
MQRTRGADLGTGQRDLPHCIVLGSGHADHDGSGVLSAAADHHQSAPWRQLRHNPRPTAGFRFLEHHELDQAIREERSTWRFAG